MGKEGYLLSFTFEDNELRLVSLVSQRKGTICHRENALLMDPGFLLRKVSLAL